MPAIQSAEMAILEMEKTVMMGIQIAATDAVPPAFMRVLRPKIQCAETAKKIRVKTVMMGIKIMATAAVAAD